MTFERFVENVDAVIRARIRRDYGLYAGPNVAYWHYGEISARVRAGVADDVELDVVTTGAPPPLRARCDAIGAQRVAETIVASWS